QFKQIDGAGAVTLACDSGGLLEAAGSASENAIPLPGVLEVRQRVLGIFQCMQHRALVDLKHPTCIGATGFYAGTYASNIEERPVDTEYDCTGRAGGREEGAARQRLSSDE